MRSEDAVQDLLRDLMGVKSAINRMDFGQAAERAERIRSEIAKTLSFHDLSLRLEVRERAVKLVKDWKESDSIMIELGDMLREARDKSNVPDEFLSLFREIDACAARHGFALSSADTYAGFAEEVIDNHQKQQEQRA